MDNTMNASLRPKKIRVSRKRQITIPIKYFTRFGITDEVECVPTENGILLRPVISDEEKGEFDDYILADLIKEGYSGDSLLEEFKARKAKIRPAVEKMIEHAHQVALGNEKGYTVEEVFGKVK